MTGFVVSHTHWDRAWYLPFERFRVRLVRLVERLCALLESDPAFAAFTLDGQTVLLEDVFDVRPDLRPRVERLVAAERLVVGPFYVLPDLFLVSFESLVRNLARGLALRDALGTPPDARPVGYVPDPFGQPEAMPTLLRGFGIDAFFFSRGAGTAHGTDDPLSRTPPRAAFWWTGPDGSRVLALYGRDGYFNAAALGHADDYGRFDGAPPHAALAVAQIEGTADRFRGLMPTGAPLLLLNGFDHMPEQPTLPGLLADVADARPDWDLRHTTLADYVDALREALEASGEALPVVRGDLLGNAHHPVLASVWSTRLYLKRAHDTAERFLLDVAEPVAAMLPGMEATPDARPLLDLAWRSLLRAQPHDDLCGCSVDAVHLDTEAAIRHARETALEAVRERLDALVLGGLSPIDAPAGTDVIVVHSHPSARRVTVDVDVLVANDGGEFGTVPPPRRLAAVDGSGRPVEVVVLATEAPVLRSAYLSATWGRRYRLRLTLDAPACGYTVVRVYEDGDLDDDARGPLALNRPAAALARRLRIKWERDAGDTYSFSPVPEPVEGVDGSDADRAPVAPRVWMARLARLRPHPTDLHAVRATWTLDVPARLNADPTGLSLVPDLAVPMVRLTLRAELRDEGAAGVSVRVRIRNRARDGRLRLVLPTGCAPAASVRTGSHLGLTPRTRTAIATPETAPDRYAAFPGELDYATHPMRDFVLIEDGPGTPTASAHRAWVAARGMPEVETRADAEETWVAVTLCRAVGWLSRKGGRIRRVAAGPQLPTPGAQCLRTMGGDVLVGSAGGSEASEVVAAGHARAFAHPAWATEVPALPYAPASGKAPRRASWLAVDEPAVRLLSMRPESDRSKASSPGCVIRLVNPTAQARTAHLTLGFPALLACRTDLREQWDDAAAERVVEGRLALAMAPGEVVTVVVRA